MNKFKTALAGAAAIGLILAGAANAEPIRANTTLPSNTLVKKSKIVRSSAPAKREARAIGGTSIALGLLVAGAAGVGIYEATKSDDDSTGG